MGLISDRKAKKQREKEKELEKLKNAQNRALSPLKKGAGPGGGGRGGARVWCRKRFPLRTEYTRRNDQRTWYDQRADGERVLGRIVFMFV